MKAKIKKDTLVSYDIMFLRGQIEEARKEHAAIEILKANNFRYDAMINHLDKLVINLNHEANKDGGTSVGFTKVKSNRIEKDLFVEFPVKSDNGWISVKDRLPNKYDHVLLYSTQKLKRLDNIFDGWYNGKDSKNDLFEWDSYGTVDGDQYKIKITHWRPLPKPPKNI